jgi:hypothetical protein
MRSSSIHIATVLVALATSVSATTLERLSMDSMTDQSMVVVRGRITGGAGELANGAISTHYQFKVTEVWKGSASTSIDVYVPGGAAQGFLQSVPGAPALTTGAEYVLFLWIGPSGRPQIIGLSQGLFSVSRAKNGSVYLNRGAVTEMMLDPKTGLPVTADTVHVLAADLKAFVQKRNQVSATK